MEFQKVKSKTNAQEKTFEEIMAKKFLYLVENKPLVYPRVSPTPNRINTKKTTPIHLIVKL